MPMGGQTEELHLDSMALAQLADYVGFLEEPKIMGPEPPSAVAAPNA